MSPNTYWLGFWGPGPVGPAQGVRRFEKPFRIGVQIVLHRGMVALRHGSVAPFSKERSGTRIGLAMSTEDRT
jgi:hypothetical protein